MTSRLDDTLSALATRYADTTVSFEAGKLVLNKHAQQRKIILTRQAGRLRFSNAKGKTVFSTPVSGAGTITQQRFERFELLECTLRAEDEDALDLMFDRFVNTVFEEFGPSAFEEVNDYEWFQGDSTAGGDWSRRNPAIKLHIRVRLASRSQPLGQFVVLETAGATADIGPSGATGPVGPTGDYVHILQPVAGP